MSRGERVQKNEYTQHKYWRVQLKLTGNSRPKNCNRHDYHLHYRERATRLAATQPAQHCQQHCQRCHHLHGIGISIQQESH